MRWSSSLLALAATSLLGMGVAHATDDEFRAVLRGAEEVPPVTTNTTGVATSSASSTVASTAGVGGSSFVCDPPADPGRPSLQGGSAHRRSVAQDVPERLQARVAA